jgi:hypothetical protein
MIFLGSMESIMAESKWVTELVQRARNADWPVNDTNSGHYRIIPPVGQIIILPRTSSDYRAERNAKADFKRAGIDLAERAAASRKQRRAAQNIRLDREKNERALKEAMMKMSEDKVNGLLVKDRHRAQVPTVKPDVTQVLPDGDEVLLEDGSILYQCMLTKNGKFCGKTFDKGTSLRVHRIHHFRSKSSYQRDRKEDGKFVTPVPPPVATPLPPEPKSIEPTYVARTELETRISAIEKAVNAGLMSEQAVMTHKEAFLDMVTLQEAIAKDLRELYKAIYGE